MAKPIDEKYNADILKAFLAGFSVDLNHLRVAVKELEQERAAAILSAESADKRLEAQGWELEKGRSNAG